MKSCLEPNAALQKVVENINALLESTHNIETTWMPTFFFSLLSLAHFRKEKC